MVRKILFGTVLFFVIFFIGLSSFGDTVYFKNGVSIEGNIMAETENEIIIQSEKYGEGKIRKSLIKSVDYTQPRQENSSISSASVIPAETVANTSDSNKNSPIAPEPAKDKYFTVKLQGGYNVWALASYAFGSSSLFKIDTGGISFGGAFLYGKSSEIQLGLSGAFLPMLSKSSVSMSIIPITADIVFNTGFFYYDFGAGVALLLAGENIGSVLFGNSSYSPSPGFLIKIGFGFCIKITDSISLDFSDTAYLPLTDFGMIAASGLPVQSFLQNNTFLNLMLDLALFGQNNTAIGINFYF